MPNSLAENLEERWIVTEYYPLGTLEHHLENFKGRPLPALKALRRLVFAIAALHDEGIVHRDIKPANVFVYQDDELILGDFGIVYLPASAERLTATNERVGPRDYMPPWADLRTRHERPDPTFDVYMLAKLLWCMLAGRPKLPREYYKRPDFNLVQLFPEVPALQHVNNLLGACLVEASDKCLQNGSALLRQIDRTIALIELEVPTRDEGGSLQLPCKVCGMGKYQPRQDQLSMQNPIGHPLQLSVYVCNVCNHYQFFAAGSPEQSFKARGF